jgi:hypothetical protein
MQGVLFKEQPLPPGSFSEKKVHFQAADIAAIKSCSLRGIEARAAGSTNELPYCEHSKCYACSPPSIPQDNLLYIRAKG